MRRIKDCGDLMTKRKSIFPACLAAVVFVLFSTALVSARIPEPDNIVYGVFPDAQTVITLKFNGAVVAGYTFGENPMANDFFILRVPLDAVDPQDTGGLRPGDVCELFLGAETEAVASVVLGQRGTIQRVFLPGNNDVDGDSVSDSTDNCVNVPNPDQGDANGNGIGDACDDADTDGDGYSDRLEYAYMHMQPPRLDLNGNPYSLVAANPPGDVGYIAPKKMLAITRDGGCYGTVSSSPAGISCGVDCDYSFTDSTTVTLTATADKGCEFSGWSGDVDSSCQSQTGSCTVTMDQARTVSASFIKASFPWNLFLPAMMKNAP